MEPILASTKVKERPKCRERKDLQIIQNTSLSVKHGWGCVMAWACIVVSGTGSIILTYGGRMKSEVYRNFKFTEKYQFTGKCIWLEGISSGIKTMSQSTLPTHQGIYQRKGKAKSISRP